MVSNGHIHAPVSLAEVASIIGESEANLKTVCLSDKINPYSIIRPLYSESLDLEPKDFKNALVFGPIPENGDGYYFKRMTWGYFVPYVSNPTEISKIKNVAWKRNLPTADTCLCLSHFDGYLHNAVPSFAISAHIEASDEIQIYITPGRSQSNIVSESGIGNNGGVVSIYDVLGNVKIGCTLFKGNAVLGHFISYDNPETESYNKSILFATGIDAEAASTYTVIPWATNGDIINGNVQTGSIFYSFCFVESFVSYIQKSVPFMSVVLKYVTWKRVFGLITVNATVENQFPNVQRVYGFKLHVIYDYAGQTKTRDVNLQGESYIDIPSQSSVDVTLTTTDGEITNTATKLRSMHLIATWLSSTGEITIQSLELIKDIPIS